MEIIMKKFLLSLLMGWLTVTCAQAQEPAVEAPVAPAEAAPEAAPAEETPTVRGPRIFCEEPNFDFGAVDTQKPVEHTFVFKNIGDTTLEISSVRPACGCTVADMSEKVIPPGGESRLTARLSLQGRSGPQSKAITINSNDPENPQYRVNMSGTIQQALQISPDRLIFGQLGPGQEAELFIELTGTSPEPFTVQKIETTDAHLTATAEVIEEGKRHRIIAKIKAPDQSGPVNAVVRITTDHPARPVIDVPVAANVVGELIFAPSEIALPAVSDAPMTRYVVIRKGAATSFEIKEVISPDPSIKVNIFPFGDQGYRIQLENIVPSAELDGKMIKVLTTAPTMSEINVPIRITQ